MKASIPIMIPCFNNPTYAGRMVRQLLAQGCRNIQLIDNASPSPAMQTCLLDLEREGIQVTRRERNDGPRIFLDEKLYGGLPELFVITDPDLLLNPRLPDNFLDTLYLLTEKHHIGKAGFALDIHDISQLRQEKFDIGGQHFHIWEWEEKFWKHPNEPTPDGDPVYKANIDTTFALYNKRYFDPCHYLTAVRVGGKFTCKHLPWYRQSDIPMNELADYIETQEYSFYLSKPHKRGTVERFVTWFRRYR